MVENKKTTTEEKMENCKRNFEILEGNYCRVF